MALLLLRNSAITPSVRLGLPIRASLRERTSSSSLSTLFSTRARAARVTGVPFSSAILYLVHRPEGRVPSPDEIICECDRKTLLQERLAVRRRCLGNLGEVGK